MKRIGIDIGSQTLKVVSLENGNIVYKKIILHKGEILEVFNKITSSLKDGEYSIGITGDHADFLTEHFQNLSVIDSVKCLIKGVKKFYPDVRNIIEIGAASSKLIEIGDNGEFKNLTTNSLCAAGTGSFLDQQKERLGLDYKEIAKWKDIPQSPPTIASRCTVFAKTDLINRQQEGYSKMEMWAGLCKGMSASVIQTLFKGKPVEGKTALSGGTARNLFLIDYLKKKTGQDLVYDKEISPLFQAVGAAIEGSTPPSETDFFERKKRGRRKKKEENIPLLLKRSSFPDFNVYKERIHKNKTEIRIHRCLEKIKNAYIGIDVGSTSTKAVLMDEETNIAADFYRGTEGDPVSATMKLFEVITETLKQEKSSMKIKGAGTTGSGRTLVGNFVGADVIINEITAHAKGTLHIFPDIEVIFEIGGQDSKYIRIKDGSVYDCNMNYVCAAGTGSFLEEQAKKLGYDIKEVSDIIMGISPPVSQERCTVFMEQDIDKLLKEGYSKKEAMAASIYSVVQNYINRVVGRRYTPIDKIFFQGATARNKALVAGFENGLGVEVRVSPHCHVMGAYGTALIVKERLRSKTSFEGFEVKDKEFDIYYNNCPLCENHCKITYLSIGDKVVSYGYQCGREPDDTSSHINKEDDLFRFYMRKLSYVTKSRKTHIATIGIPLAISSYSLFPFYRAFLEEIGFRVLLSKRPDKKTVEKGKENATSDFCFPVKILFGVVDELLTRKDIDYIFLPWIISFKTSNEKANNFFCPFVESHPGYIKVGFSLRGIPQDKFITPVFDFTSKKHVMIKDLYEYFKKWGIKKAKIKKALRKARIEQVKFDKEIEKKGSEILKGIVSNGEKAIVLIGRPYTLYCNAENLGTPLKISRGGYKVIPMDFIPSFSTTDELMFWRHGGKIIDTFNFMKDKENLFPVYITNFSCGPDSFLLSYAEEIMKNRPMLILEVDEHGGDAVFQTRIEAYLDVIKEFKKKEKEKISSIFILPRDNNLKDKVIWIPPMHPVGARFFAATFRRFGFKSRAIPQTTEETWKKGMKLVRGSECLPCALTIGSFVNEIEKRPQEKHALFMPTSLGPCRFGQYIYLQRLILDREGYTNTSILSPNSFNAYSGLPQSMRMFLWKTILMYDAVVKCRSRLKPYEKNKGETERIYRDVIDRIESAIENNDNIYDEFSQCIKEFRKIKVVTTAKPIVGVVGEIYIRQDPYANDNLTECIESSGGEVWISPVSEWIWYTDFATRWRAGVSRNYIKKIKTILVNKFFRKVENEINEITEPILNERREPEIDLVLEAAMRYVPINFGTEAVLTLGRSIIFARDGARAVVNVSPFTCMPGIITQAFFHTVQKDMDIPVINMFYDGEQGINKRVKVFLENLL